ncbi:MAG: YcaO-like family protein, partial [Candidatus Latescibacteria bacterium]|nr:YcaO-like family protein [Candidatus Latescibacterota bacterium]
MTESHQIVTADRTVPFDETIARFGEALSRKCQFQARARQFYNTVWIADCYTDYVQSTLFRKYEGPLMEGIALRTMGKGLTKSQVLAGAMAEAVERISFFDALATGRETPIYELSSDVELIPTDLKASEVPHLNDSANGVSSGNTVLECVFHGLLEMHEHLDVGMHFHWPGLAHRQFIDPNLTGFSTADKMLAVAAPGENEKVTTVHAVVCPKDLGPLVRTCTHLDGRIALQRAFNETVQSHKTRFASDLQTFAPEIVLWDLPNHFTDDLVQDIQVVLSGMKDPVYVQDWTDPDMQIPVLRPFSP